MNWKSLTGRFGVFVATAEDPETPELIEVRVMALDGGGAELIAEAITGDHLAAKDVPRLADEADLTRAMTGVAQAAGYVRQDGYCAIVPTFETVAAAA